MRKKLTLIACGVHSYGYTFNSEIWCSVIKIFPSSQSFQYFSYFGKFLHKPEELQGECRPKSYSSMTLFRQLFKNKANWFYSQLMQLGKGFKWHWKEDTHRKAWASTQGIKRYWHNSLEKNRSEEKRGGIIEQLKEDEWQFITFSLIF